MADKCIKTKDPDPQKWQVEKDANGLNKFE